MPLKSKHCLGMTHTTRHLYSPTVKKRMKLINLADDKVVRKVEVKLLNCWGERLQLRVSISFHIESISLL